MPCPCYKDCGNRCGGCGHFRRTTSVASSGSLLQLILPAEETCNREILCVCIAQSIPSTTLRNSNVVITIGNDSYKVINKCGNYVYADQIKSRMVLHVSLAKDSKLAILVGCNKLRPGGEYCE